MQVGYLINSMKTQNETPPRLQWFLDRIGKTVYRNKTTCPCAPCAEVYQQGLHIGDAMHADYLYDFEGQSNYADRPLEYFDTIAERDEFEKKIKSKKNANESNGN